MKCSIAILVALFCHCGRLADGYGLREEFTWSRLTYAVPPGTFYRPGYAGPPKDSWIPFDAYGPSGEEGEDLNNEYIFENNLPQGANRWRNKLFITVPRRKPGVPSTLNYVPIDSIERHNVPLIPYPDIKTNRITAPEGEEHIVSVLRLAIDPCDRMWLVDSGTVNSLGNQTRIHPQRIVIIDLHTDRIIKTYTFKDTDLTYYSALPMTVVDVTPENCDDAHAYFPDLAGYGLVVYSLKRDDSWRVNHNYFFLEPQNGDFNIGGLSFQWNDGAFSIALTDIKEDGTRDAIFHAMAATNLYSVSTGILKNKKLATREYHGRDFVVLGDRGPCSQTSASDLHKPTGVLFLNLVNQNAIGCWNIWKSFSPYNFGIVHKNDTAMIYPADLKIYRDQLIVLSNSMPIYLYSTLDYNEINFRVWMNDVHKAVRGTICESQSANIFWG